MDLQNLTSFKISETFVEIRRVVRWPEDIVARSLNFYIGLFLQNDASIFTFIKVIVVF